MSLTACVRHRATKNPKKVDRILGFSGLAGIKSAPVYRKMMRTVDWDFQERKVNLAHKIPIYTLKQVQKLRLPYHILITQNLAEEDYPAVVDEISLILWKEEAEMLTHRDYKEESILNKRDLFTLLAETLKFCQNLIDARKVEHAIKLRFELAIKMMKHKAVWLSKHLLQTALQLANEISPDNQSQQRRFEAEIHCLLAYLARSNENSQENFDISKMEDTLDHLTICRNISMGEPWHFKVNVVKINIRRAIDLHGLRKDESFIDGNIMPLYMVACLLEHEMLLKLANKILFGQTNPSDEDVLLAIHYAEDALELALEVREPEAISSALFRFGQVLRDAGAYEEAMDYFDQLQMHAEVKGDRATEAIGFHGLATCFNAKQEPTNAMEMLALQFDVGRNIIDIEAEAAKEMGHVLLVEGHLIEAQECLAVAYSQFLAAQDTYKTPDYWIDVSWSLSALTVGQVLWGRMAGLVRQNTSWNLKAVIQFKNQRSPLPLVKRPHYNVQPIQKEWREETETGRSSGSSSSVEDDPNNVPPDHEHRVHHLHPRHHKHHHHHHHVQEEYEEDTESRPHHPSDHQHEIHHHHSSDDLSRFPTVSELFKSKDYIDKIREERQRQKKMSETTEGWFAHAHRAPSHCALKSRSRGSRPYKREGESILTDSESYSDSSGFGSSPFDSDMLYESDRGRVTMKSKSILSRKSSTTSHQTTSSSERSHLYGGLTKVYSSKEGSTAPGTAKLVHGDSKSLTIQLDHFRKHHSEQSKILINRIPAHMNTRHPHARDQMGGQHPHTRRFSRSRIHPTRRTSQTPPSHGQSRLKNYAFGPQSPNIYSHHTSSGRTPTSH